MGEQGRRTVAHCQGPRTAHICNLRPSCSLLYYRVVRSPSPSPFPTGSPVAQVEDRPVVKERVEYVKEHRPVEKEYVVSACR